jgi:hypothetical protein
MFRALAWCCRFFNRRAVLASVIAKAFFSSYASPLTIIAHIIRARWTPSLPLVRPCGPSAPPNSFRGFPSRSSVRPGHDAFGFPQPPFEAAHVFSHRPVRPAQCVGLFWFRS